MPEPPGGGPLRGLRVVELAGLGPAPFAAMMLADAGADVLRVERADRVYAPGTPNAYAPYDATGRGRRCAAVDLKKPEGVEAVLRLAEAADAFIEPFRPGVAERLGIGPEPCLARNPRLVYGRMTGWGQDGPLSRAEGHDINYLSITGALHAIGPADGPPVVPLNLVADFGGGGMLLAFGLLAAVVEARASGQGQVVDAAMVDGVALQMAAISGMQAMGIWIDERGRNFLDGGAPFYGVYECADGRHVAVGAIEPAFYASLLERLGLDDDDAAGTLPAQDDQLAWPTMRERFAAIFRTRSRDEWVDHCAGHPCCLTPVLSIAESRDHPHHRARGTFVDVGGAPQPAPAPRFSRTPAAVARPAAAPGQHTDEALADWGFPPADLLALRRAGAIA